MEVERLDLLLDRLYRSTGVNYQKAGEEDEGVKEGRKEERGNERRRDGEETYLPSDGNVSHLVSLAVDKLGGLAVEELRMKSVSAAKYRTPNSGTGLRILT